MTNKNGTNTQTDQLQENDQVNDFETAYSELETIVKRMELGDQGLENSLTDFEHGIKLIKLCHQHLQNAEQRILLLSENQDGEVTSQPFIQES